MPFELRRLGPADAVMFQKLRLEALSLVPEAFGESAAEHARIPLEEWERRLEASDADRFVLGGFEHGVLLATAGFRRDTRDKRSHKGHIWGMYVAPSLRRQGAGEALLAEIIRHARTQPGLRTLLLSVSETQPAARKLYEKLGFRLYGVEPAALAVGDRLLAEEFLVLTLY